MKHDRLFPTNIFKQSDFMPEEDLRAMKNDILKRYTEPRHRWQTDHMLHEREPYIKLANKVITHTGLIMDELTTMYDDVGITGMWGNILKKGESHDVHTHSNNWLSGVYYLEADDTEGISFLDPRPAASVFQPHCYSSIDNSHLIKYPAKKNQIYFFPSWLMHYVPTVMNDNLRISIAFNIQLKGNVGVPEDLQYAKF